MYPLASSEKDGQNYLEKAMEFRKLGRTNIDVSVIGMGCWPITGDTNWGPQDEKDSVMTIEAALDTGINFFDTAEGYGDGYSESILGKTLAGHRNRVIIASKVNDSNLSADGIQKACERSLKRLKTNYIDLYQVHWPSLNVPLEEIMGTFEKLQKQGMVRAVGVCNFGVENLSNLLALGDCQTNQLPYSLLWRAIEYKIRQKCIENRVGVICYCPLAQGLLTGKFASADDVPEGRARTRYFSKNRPQTRHNEMGHESETFMAIEQIRRICKEIHEPMAKVALAWLLEQPAVTSVLVGARRPEQIKQNAQATTLKLSGDIIKKLTKVTENLKLQLGENPDMWQSQSRMR